MDKPEINVVTITLEEYFELRQKAEMNGYLMDRLGQMDEQLRQFANRLYEFENELHNLHNK